MSRSVSDPRVITHRAPPVKPTQGAELSEADLQLVRDFIRRETGIELSSDDYLIRERLFRLSRRLGLPSPRDVTQQLRQGADAKFQGAVTDAMTTNVTSFFRDPRLFARLADDILPELVDTTRAEGRPLVIWSAACASGQEAVSTAIVLLERFGPVVDRPGRVRIIATDISAPMVERTNAGTYSGWEMGEGLSDEQIARFFERRGDRWATRSSIRRMIEARPLNLLGRWTGIPRCDVVLLRNVLIYFSDGNRDLVLRRIRHEVIRPGGSLLLGGSESGLFTMTDAGFRPDRRHRATRYLPV